MRILISGIVAIVAVLGAVNASAKEIDVIVEMRGTAAPSEERAPAKIFFEGEPVLLDLKVVFLVNLNSPAAEPGRILRFPQEDWVQSVDFRVTRRSDGAQIPVKVRTIRSRLTGISSAREGEPRGKGFFLHDREGVHAEIELEGLPRDDYGIEAEVFGVKTRVRSFFSIRKGDESVPTRRLYLRKEAQRVSGNFVQYEKVMRELARISAPDHAGVLTELADWSIDKVPAAQTVGYYREAREAARNRLDRADTKTTDALRRQNREALEELETFERVLPYYQKNKDRLRFGVAVINGKVEYAWFRRVDNRLVGKVNPRDPSRGATE